MYFLFASPFTRSGMESKRRLRENLYWLNFISVSSNHRLTSCDPENVTKLDITKASNESIDSRSCSKIESDRTFSCCCSSRQFEELSVGYVRIEEWNRSGGCFAVVAAAGKVEPGSFEIGKWLFGMIDLRRLRWSNTFDFNSGLSSGVFSDGELGCNLFNESREDDLVMRTCPCLEYIVWRFEHDWRENRWIIEGSEPWMPG